MQTERTAPQLMGVGIRKQALDSPRLRYRYFQAAGSTLISLTRSLPGAGIWGDIIIGFDLIGRGFCVRHIE